MISIAILNYSVGNLKNISKALERVARGSNLRS